MRKSLLLGIGAVTAAVIAAGCSSSKSSGGGSSVTGMIQGSAMDVKSSVFANVSLGSGNSLTFGVLSDRPNFCDEISTNPPTLHVGQKVLFVQLGSYAGGSTINSADAPGTYAWFNGASAPAAQFWLGAYQVLDASCNASSNGTAQFTGGTLDVTTVSASKVAGSGTALPLGSDSIGVKFDLSNCAALATIVMSSSTAQTCVP